jgi:DNA-binding HxlR family transcriptional regulator
MDGSLHHTLTANRNCSVARALNVLGDTWTFLVLRGPFFGINKFDALQNELGIARNLLSARLTKLLKYELLKRVAYQSNPIRYEYRLTKKGLALYPALIILMNWGDRWESNAEGAPLLLRHRPCGGLFAAEVICSECENKLTARAVTYRDGPGAGTETASIARRRRSSNPDAYERGRNCSVARTLKILEDPWTYLILREVFFSVYRFDEIQRGLGIARNILTDRLNRLANGGILERSQYQNRPPRFEYRLTDKGRDLYGGLLALMAWADNWLSESNGAPLIVTHNTCGCDFKPVVICPDCHLPITAHDVEYFSSTEAIPSLPANDPKKNTRPDAQN